MRCFPLLKDWPEILSGRAIERKVLGSKKATDARVRRPCAYGYQ
jgi:hypothetical protein